MGAEEFLRNMIQAGTDRVRDALPGDPAWAATLAKRIMEYFLGPLIDNGTERHDEDGDRADGERMTERDRNQRRQDDDPASPVQTERDGEEPAHGGVDAVKGTQPHHGQLIAPSKDHCPLTLPTQTQGNRGEHDDNGGSKDPTHDPGSIGSSGHRLGHDIPPWVSITPVSLPSPASTAYVPTRFFDHGHSRHACTLVMMIPRAPRAKSSSMIWWESVRKIMA